MPAAPPLDTGATRRAHLRGILGGRAFAYGTVVTAGLALVVGAAAAGVVAAVVASAVAAGLAVAVAFTVACARATGDFWRAFAADVDMQYLGDAVLPAYSYLLGAGDRRRTRNWMRDDAPSGGERGLGNYTYEVVSGENRRRRTPYRFTIAVLPVAAAEAPFLHGVYLRPRRVLRALTAHEWWPTGRLEKVDLESAAFCGRYDLRCDRRGDRGVGDLADDEGGRVREVFSPQFIDWLARHPLDLGFEYRAGALVVFVSGHTHEAGRLVQLLDAAAAIAARFDGEIAESRHARGAAGLR